MLVEKIQEKVGHNSRTTWDSENKFQMSQGVFVRSVMIYKNYGKTDEETAAMLKKDFMLNEQQIRLILDEIKRGNHNGYFGRCEESNRGRH